MKFKPTCFSILCFTCLSGFAQEQEIQNVFKLMFLNPGVSYELPVGKSQSILFHGYSTSLQGLGYSQGVGFISTFYFDPVLAVQYRYYYNASKRHSKGKRTEMNSLNYLSPFIKCMYSKRPMSSGYFIVNDRRPITTAGVVWGIQRNYKSHFSLDLHVGLGYAFAKEKVILSGEKTTIDASGLDLPAQISLGFWLNNKKSN